MNPGHEYPFTPPSAEEAAPSAKGGWVRTHPYFAALGALVAFLGIAIFVVATRSGVPGSTIANNWVGTGGIFFTGGRNLPQAERITAPQTTGERVPDTKLGYIPIYMPPVTSDMGNNFENDLGKLLALLTQPKASTSATVETGSAFSFIPQGLISVAAPGERSAQAQAFFAYGNDVGNYIQGYESMHLNSIQILKDQIEDRANAPKAMLVKNLGDDMAALGNDLREMQTIPQGAQAAHTAFAASYEIAGANLSKIADASSDEAYLSAIATYNASVEVLAKRFLVLVSLFSANNATFSPSDPGSIFMFNPSLSL